MTTATAQTATANTNGNGAGPQGAAAAPKLKGRNKPTDIKDFLLAAGYEFFRNDLTGKLEFSFQNSYRLHIGDDEFSQVMVLLGDHKSTDADGRVRHVITAMGADNRYNPLHDCLNDWAIRWDGTTDHIGALAAHFTSTEPLFPIWLKKWLVGSVGRFFGGDPMPVFVINGPQDIGKSYFASEWLSAAFRLPGIEIPFADKIPDPDNKDDRLALTVTPIWELSEIDRFTGKREATAIKNFLTLRTITEREPWGRFPVTKQPITNFIGTFNDNGGYLTDPTGNRRFLTTEVTALDWNYTQIDPMSVWGQAAALYKWDFRNWQFDQTDKDRRNQVNEAYKIPNAVENYIDENYEFTGNSLDFVGSTAAQVDIATMLPGQANSKDLPKVIAGKFKRMGGEAAFSRINGKKMRGFECIKKLP